MNRVFRFTAALALFGVAAAPALAHPGHGGGFAAGLAHPVTGLDHLAAMLAIGLWAATREPRRAWHGPAVFILMLVVGGLAGLAGAGAGPLDPAIAGSVALLGLMLVAAPFLSDQLAIPLIGGFALLHGYAHGAEATSGVAGYFAGFVVASAVLHLAGWRVGRALFATRWGRLACGVGVGAAGLALVGL